MLGVDSTMANAASSLPRPTAAAPDSSESVFDASPSHAAQAAVGFAAGGLLAVVVALGAELWTGETAAVVCRLLGFAAGGALGGAALGYGYREGAWQGGALGFGLGYLAPAALAAPAMTELLKFETSGPAAAPYLATAIAYAAGFGLASAIGMSFVRGRLFWRAGWLGAAAGAAGGVLSAWGPALAGPRETQNASGIVAAVVTVLGGYLLAAVLGGWLAGRVLDSDARRERAKPRR